LHEGRHGSEAIRIMPERGVGSEPTSEDEGQGNGAVKTAKTKKKRRALMARPGKENRFRDYIKKEMSASAA